MSAAGFFHVDALEDAMLGPRRDQSSERRRCEFCGYPVVEWPGAESRPSATGAGDAAATGTATAGTGTDAVEGRGRFCSAACREAADRDERPFAGRQGYKYVQTGVPALDAALPQGIRGDSLVLLRADTGTNRRELQLELAWRAIRRGEPVVFASYLDAPAAVVEQFLALGWNVLPALERDLLSVVDCFTHRLSDPEEHAATMNDWNEHLTRALDGAVTTIRSPDDLREVESKLLSAVEDLGMTNRGVVVVDSLEEMGTLVSDPQVENFLKEVRADVCQNRFVPLIVGRCSDRATGAVQQQVRVSGGGLTTDVTYFADGIVDVRLNPDVVPDTRLKQFAVRRMRGVRFVPQWMTFELTGDGHLVFDPATQTRAMYETTLFGDAPTAADRGHTPAGDTRPPADAERSAPARPVD